MFGHQLRCHLDLLQPNLDAKVRQSQSRQKELHDFHARDCTLQEGDTVLTKNFSTGDPWIPGVIHSKTGPSSLTVDLNDGRRVRRHLDQLRKNTSTPIANGPPSMAETDDLVIPLSNQPTVEPLPHDVPTEPTSESSSNELRCSNQTRHPPQRFSVDIN